MPTRDLIDGAGLIVAGLHPCIAVVPVAPDLRTRAVNALRDRDGVVVIDEQQVISRLSAERERIEALRAEAVSNHDTRIADLRAARHAAGAELANAFSAVDAALSSLNEYDRAEEALEQAITARDLATAVEAGEAHRLAAVLERRQRLTAQRQDAMRIIEELEERGPVRRSGELRARVSEMDAGLARAEAEQTRAERSAEAALHQAREGRVAAVGDLDRADRALRAELPGLPGVPVPDWPPGPPLRVLVAERRDLMAGVLGGLYTAATAARSALDLATEALRSAEADRDGVGRAALVHGIGAAVEALLVSTLERSTTPVEMVVCDEPFSGIEPAIVTPVLERFPEKRSVQVVYLTDDNRILAWAKGLRPETGAMAACNPGQDLIA